MNDLKWRSAFKIRLYRLTFTSRKLPCSSELHVFPKHFVSLKFSINMEYNRNNIYVPACMTGIGQPEKPPDPYQLLSCSNGSQRALLTAFMTGVIMLGFGVLQLRAFLNPKDVSNPLHLIFAVVLLAFSIFLIPFPAMQCCYEYSRYRHQLQQYRASQAGVGAGLPLIEHPLAIPESSRRASAISAPDTCFGEQRVIHPTAPERQHGGQISDPPPPYSLVAMEPLYTDISGRRSPYYMFRREEMETYPAPPKYTPYAFIPHSASALRQTERSYSPLHNTQVSPEMASPGRTSPEMVSPGRLSPEMTYPGRTSPYQSSPGGARSFSPSTQTTQLSPYS